MDNNFVCVNSLCGEIRAFICDGKPWFNASDVCSVLKLPDFNEAFYRLDKSTRDWKCMTLGTSIPLSVPVVYPEGLYALYMSGKEPETKYLEDALLNGLFPMMGLLGSSVADRFRLRGVKTIPVASAPQPSAGLQVFKHERFGSIRTVMINGEPWFVAKDVCDVLGLSNPTVAIDRLDMDERSKFNLGRQGEVNIANEYGLYNLILASRKPEAKQFKRWITHEVIPSIRKHGGYTLAQNNDSLAVNANEVRRLTEELQQIKSSIAELSRVIGQFQVTPARLCSKNDSDLITATAIANAFGYDARCLNRYLAKKGVLSRHGRLWMLRPEYAERGYAKSDKHRMYWTQKGAQFIYELLKEDGVMPIWSIPTIQA